MDMPSLSFSDMAHRDLGSNRVFCVHFVVRIDSSDRGALGNTVA